MASAAAPAPAVHPKPRLRIFVSYSHADDAWREAVVIWLAQLKNEGLIDLWHDRRITGGQEWAGQIDDNLDNAEIILLLVTPNFLASAYCNDIEMTRALERHAKGEARVIPIILTPADWKTSRFAKLQVFPKDGKPVVDWPTKDHGLANAIEGLRNVINELRRPQPAPLPIPIPPPVRRFARHWYWLLAALLTGILTYAWWRLQSNHIQAGEALLDIGRYQPASAPFNNALRWNPWNGRAQTGLAVIKLDQLKRSDPVFYQQELKQLRANNPTNPYFALFEGDRLLANGDPTRAMELYDQAALLRPQYAEAHFQKGILNDKLGRRRQALLDFQKAKDLSPATPRYLNNLADQHFKRGEYPDALRLYGQLDRFPLGAIESARILRLQGDLNRAADAGQTAIAWLANKQIAGLEENRWPWYFDAETEERITAPEDKLCLAQMELALTRFLLHDEPTARQLLNDAHGQCRSHLTALNAILASHLDRLKTERDDLAPAAARFSQILQLPK
ncbi:MAG: TIR domain-containing protein [Bryobacterales bacterium]|nr:TIR domain-containing protein [Bryobacterales bacterium]